MDFKKKFFTLIFFITLFLANVLIIPDNIIIVYVNICLSIFRPGARCTDLNSYCVSCILYPVSCVWIFFCIWKKKWVRVPCNTKHYRSYIFLFHRKDLIRLEPFLSLMTSMVFYNWKIMDLHY